MPQEEGRIREQQWEWEARCQSVFFFFLQYEDAPTIGTFAGMFSITSHFTYALVETGATHSCMSEEFRNACSLNAKVIPYLGMYVNTPLRLSSLVIKVVKYVDVLVEGCHMPIDMLVFPMSDFGVMFSMN